MNVGSLFAGIGGFDLAARWMGWETRWFSEIDPYASAVLQKHWPGVPNHGDITEIDFTTVEPVDLLCGGFPCQDISNAGKRAGIEGSRSGLWGEFARAIREIRPRYVVVENVAALLARGFDAVLGDLAEIGYDAEWAVLSAADVGAPHLRERVWITAYPHRYVERIQPLNVAERGDQTITGDNGSSRTMAYPFGLRELQPEGGQSDQRRRPGDCGAQTPMADTSEPIGERRSTRARRRSGIETETPESHARGGSPPDGNWSTEPDVGRVAHGIPARVDRLRGLGNAIRPAMRLPNLQSNPRSGRTDEGRMKPRKAIKRSVKPIKRSTKRIRSRRGDPAKRRWARHRDPDFIKWIKEQVCAICGKWPVDPAHIRKRSLGSDDRDNVIPLCRWHHDEQEDRDAEFEARYKVRLNDLAQWYTARYLAEAA